MSDSLSAAAAATTLALVPAAIAAASLKELLLVLFFAIMWRDPGLAESSLGIFPLGDEVNGWDALTGCLEAPTCVLVGRDPRPDVDRASSAPSLLFLGGEVMLVIPEETVCVAFGGLIGAMGAVWLAGGC